MPLNSSQLAALVERAKLRPPPVAVAQPPAPRRQKLPDKTPKPKPAEQSTQSTPAAPPSQHHPEAVLALPAATTSDDFPVGWDLKKESWHFHRRFFAVFRRPMQHGEYSHLLHQIRFGRAEHLCEDCWRVTLPGGRTLPIRATRWRLITLLPKHWQPPAPAPSNAAVETGVAAEPLCGTQEPRRGPG